MKTTSQHSTAETASPEPKRIDRCRACGNRSLIPCASIGAQYLSSVFPTSLAYREGMKPLPLDLVLCQKNSDDCCGLVQLAHEFDLSAMYEAYPYTSSTNSSMSAILSDVASSGKTLGHLRPGDAVLDIGCNDGTLLSFFKEDSFDLIGIDPAKNIKPILDAGRWTHVRDYFNAAAYSRVAPKKARLVFSIAMYYHLHDPVSFSADVAKCLDDDGVWIIQMAYLPAMLKTNMYDNIVHEHAGYYSTHAMDWIMRKAGLEIFDVELNDVYGGSFRIFVKKQGCKKFPPTRRYKDNLLEEQELKILEPATYEAFMQRLQKTRRDLQALCRKIKAEGKTIWVYGASTKGNTILQYCEIGKNEIAAAADANPFKLGKYIIGADIPIKDEASMRAARPDFLLALPYSFLDGFMKRETELLSRGTKFIVPLPDVRLAP